jgi:hypothetical protein
MPPTPQPPLAAFRKVFLRMTFGYALFAAPLLLLLPTKPVLHPLFAVSVALSAVSVAVAPFIGRVRPLPPGTPAQTAMDMYRKGLFLRLSVVQAPALVGMLVAFILGTTVPFLVSVAVSAVLMFLFVIPTEKSVRAAEARLDSGGAVCGLSEQFGA